MWKLNKQNFLSLITNQNKMQLSLNKMTASQL